MLWVIRCHWALHDGSVVRSEVIGIEVRAWRGYEKVVCEEGRRGWHG